LKKLEGVVRSLGSQTGIAAEGQSPETRGNAESPSATKEESIEEKKDGAVSHEERIKNACLEIKELRKAQYEKEAREGKKSLSTGLENRFGRLVVDEGRSRYINPSFWASLSSEVCFLSLRPLVLIKS
jgi:hypothetical protein